MMTALLFVILQSAATPIERIQAKLPVEVVKPSLVADLAGHYTTASSELRKQVGGFLSGENLYLFADQTYVYCEWGDIEPLTLYDSGTWAVASGQVTLRSDPARKWHSRLEKTYLAVRRAGRPQDSILVGLTERLSYFEDEARDDPEFMLLLVGLVREKALGMSEGIRVKRKLLQQTRGDRGGK
jgi:hypothetical protein